MSILEDQVRAALQEIAADARSAPLLQRLEAARSEPRSPFTRPRVVVGAVAAAIVVVLVAVGIVRVEQRQAVDPVQQPPKILRLSDDGTSSPGRGWMAVSLAADSGHDNTPAYLLPAAGKTATLLPETYQLEGAWTQHLSTDGAHFVRQSWMAANPLLEIIDLRTGEVDSLDQPIGHCPQLSPDNTAVAAQSADSRALVVIDRRSGRQTRLGPADAQCGYNTLGWSPDGDRLAIRTASGSRVVDRTGAVLRQIPGRTITNGSMSWSPDGRDLLMYEARTGRFWLVPADSGSARDLPTPVPGGKPLGWTGDRVVWLVGDVGAQRLVTTDRQGADLQLWTRLELGGRAVDTVTWSQALSGNVSD